jgi:Tol biopolymer transport system component
MRKRALFAAIGTALLFALAWLATQAWLTQSSQAAIGDSFGLSPHWDWKTLETPHFRVTFPAELEASARKTADYLEEAHAALSPKLYWKPWYRTQVLVIDNEDLANGLASPQLRLGIVIWATPPDAWFSTAYYDDWLRLVAFHEYTHHLNMDNVQDFYVPLRYLLGDLLLPNSAWPTWMIEGLAVYMETRFTRGGRGRSPYYEMVLRSAVEENVLDSSAFQTLDRVNGSVPYNPAGEVPYLFGYQLMNQAARVPRPGGSLATADASGVLAPGTASHPSEDALGVMSLRSARRFPYFINGNLENILGRDWHRLWDEFVAETRQRAGAQLARIRSKPVTKLKRLSPDERGSAGIPALGPTPSADGRWLAYTSDTPDRRSGLYLRELKTGRVRRLDDKLVGATAAFTPDSRTIVYSTLERQSVYRQFSGLEAYDVERDRGYRLASGLRARDPDVSPDGQWIAFTLTESQATRLAIAPLSRDEGSGELKLGEIRRLPETAARHDRVTTPRFSRDGSRVFYSLHRNGKLGEDLMSWSVSSGEITTLVADGKFNRYPAPSADGNLYFVSDRTGVDNLYRLAGGGSVPELVSNMTTGLATPAIGPEGEIYAAVYASNGWSIALLEPLKTAGAKALKAEELTIDPPPAPPVAEAPAQATRASESAQVSDYSIFPSIWPRQWYLIPQLLPGDGAYVQGGLSGFDAVDRHEYQAAAGYNSQTSKADGSLSYANRSLGPTLSLFGAQHTTDHVFTDAGVTDYTRKHQYAAQLSYPFLWTYSSLVPILGVGAEQTFAHFRGYDPGNDDLVYKSPFVATADMSLHFSDLEHSRLSIAAEGGRTLAGGVRLYNNTSRARQTWKAAGQATQYLGLWGHAVLIPSLKGAFTTRFDGSYADANASAEGRDADFLPQGNTPLFDSIYLRGYPDRNFYSRSVAVGSLDLRVPLARIYRGWGTYPIFVEQLYAFGFVEGARFPSQPGVPTLPSAGGGLTLKTRVLLHVPLSFTLEYDYGFRPEFGGKDDVFITFGLGAIPL